MLQIALAWAALGLLLGAFARLAGARAAYPPGFGRMVTLARWALPPATVALLAVMGGLIATLVVGRLAATTAALGIAAVAALLIALLSRRSASSSAP